jgi:tetratricopeptide (TPR) repeat protein
MEIKDDLEEKNAIEAYCNLFRYGHVDETLKILESMKHPIAKILQILLRTPLYSLRTEIEVTESIRSEIKLYLNLLSEWRNSDFATKDELYIVAACQNSSLIPATSTQDTIDIYERSANLGSYLAMNDLGYLIQSSNPERAFKFFESAAKEGNVPMAYINMGYCYQEGIGTQKDDSLSKTLYELSGVIGLNNLATCFELGIGCSIDYARAAELFQKSTEMGVVDSMYSLSILYSKGGYGLAKNVEESIRYLDMAASRGHEEAIRKRDSLFDDFFCVHMGCSCKTML